MLVKDLVSLLLLWRERFGVQLNVSALRLGHGSVLRELDTLLC